MQKEDHETVVEMGLMLRVKPRTLNRSQEDQRFPENHKMRKRHGTAASPLSSENGHLYFKFLS